jgi:hypothetical protein
MEKCKVEGCNRDTHCKGMCKKHYEKMRRHNKIKKLMSLPKQKCKVDNCNEIALYNGYCKRHHSQLRSYGKILERTKFDKNEIILHEDYAEIVLYNIKNKPIDKVKVDLENLENLRQYKWMINYHGYAVGRVNGIMKQMHRVILNAPKDMIIDHINRNTLDNRKNNLRICNKSQNAMNSKIPSDNTSGAKGVYWNKRYSKWEVRICLKGHNKFLGYFEDKQDAIEARRKAELKYFGEYSALNRETQKLKQDRVVDNKYHSFLFFDK